MDPEDGNGAGRPYSLSYKALSAIVILIFLFGGGWAAVGPGSGMEAGTGRTKLELDGIGRKLGAQAIAGLKEADAAATAEDLIAASLIGGIDPRESLGAAFPEPHAVLAMLALDRDVDGFLDYAERDDEAGDYYRGEAGLAKTMRPLRSRYEAAYSCAYYALAGKRKGEAVGTLSLSGRGRKRPYIASPDDVWLPAKDELKFSHPYALDVFFVHMDRSGEAERGPVIRALYPGIVVASACDWSGGQGVANWKGGGLSPAAGNGLVIYDPATRRYCSYFHLSATDLRVGDTVEAGQALGRGGNSGMNARKKGHGGHVHIEIFDSSRGQSLASQEILELLKS